jgi:peptidoglycan/LPS O-acetylase OafA/YrhL
MKSQRNLSLDGLRGIAILMVVLHHATMNLGHHWWPVNTIFNVLKSGWIGVEVFFALSGFLITGILIEKKQSVAPNFFRSFYVRRALRIMPLYLGVVALLTLVVLLTDLVTADTQDRYLNTLPWLFLHAANIAREYYGGPVLEFEWFELTHFWTLAVEEHFYLFWPVIIYWVRHRFLLWVAISIVIASWILQALSVGESAPLIRGILSTPKHLYGLALGSLAAIVAINRRSGEDIAGWAKLILIGAFLGVSLCVAFNLAAHGEIWKPVMGLLAAAAASSAALYVTVRHNGVLSSMLRHRTLRFFGK